MYNMGGASYMKNNKSNKVKQAGKVAVLIGAATALVTSLIRDKKRKEEK